MNPRSWLRKLFSPRALAPVSASNRDHKRRGKDRARLTLEALEDRLAPATLGAYSMVEGPAAGADSVVLADTAAWTATSNSPFLHITAGSASGSGNAVIQYRFDANSGATRSGTLSIAGLTLTVTQAGSTYVAVQPLTTLVSGLIFPEGVAVDAAGNVYIADGNNALKEWNATTQQVSTLVSGLDKPTAVAVDAAGNVYFADSGNKALKEWNATTQQVSTLVSSGLDNPQGVAVDAAGNVYIADSFNNALKEWNATTQQVSTLVSSGLDNPRGVAVDAAGNVFIADYVNNALKEWNATTQQVSTLVSSGLNRPYGVAVDAAGNVYFADTDNNALKEWNATTQQVSTLVSGLSFPEGVAVDAASNVFIANTDNNAIKALTRAFVPGAAVSEGPAAGSAHLLPVLPSSQALSGPFAPSSDQPWLTLGASANGVVNFSFTQNTGPARTAHLTILGQQITVTQQPFLASSSVVEGPAAGADSVVLADTAAWTATSNTPFLHVAAGSASGSGNALIQYRFDANSGVTRSGTLSIAGETFTVTQAGSTYVAANPLTTLVSSGVNGPYGVAVDAAGNVYFADTNNKALKEWNATTQQVSTLVSSGLDNPTGVAVDAAGNVYFADTNNNAIKEWNATTQQVSTLVSSGLDSEGVAVDAAGNVYFADFGHKALKEWNATTQQVSTLVSGLTAPSGVAVDAAGNVYITDSNIIDSDYAVKEWNATTQQVSTLVSTGLHFPAGVAVDAAGNVYIADSFNGAVKEWNATTQQVSTLVSGLILPAGVAVDAAGNVFIADTDNNALKTLTRAFVPGAAVSEGPAAGSAHLLPVLPTSQALTGPFAPSSDQSWLTLGASANGVVNFSFTQNTGSARTAHLTVLGQQITVLDAGPVAPSLTWSNPADITYGTALGPTQLDATANVSGTFTYTPAAGTVLNAGPGQSLSVLFTPTDTVDYTTATLTVTINVLPAPLTISPDAGQSKVYGAAVPALTYTPSGFVNGDPASTLSGALGTTATAASPVGNYPFTTDGLSAGVNYTVALAANAPTFAVTRATPTLTWTDPADIVYGTALGGTQLDATASAVVNGNTVSVPGTFRYTLADGTTPAVGAVLPAGQNQTLLVSFTPADSTDFSSASASTTVNVDQATPTITWASPAPITYGTPLGRSQLDATADVPGNFTYTPAAGTVFQSGRQTLSVTFAPLDTRDYTTATATVSLVINKATPTITWASPAAIVYSTPLSATQLDATTSALVNGNTVSVPGTFRYTLADGNPPAVGAVLPAGQNQTLLVSFTPADSTDFTSASGSTTVNVELLSPGPVAGIFSNGVNRLVAPDSWVVLTSAHATLLAVDPAGNIYAEFPGYGVQQWLGGTTWRQLTPSDASVLATGGSAAHPMLVGTFSNGVNQLISPNNWVVLASAHATLLAVDPAGTIYGEFPGYGVLQWLGSTTWQQLTSCDALVLTTGGTAAHPMLVGTFSNGVNQLVSPNNWLLLTSVGAALLGVDAAGDVFGGFGNAGVYQYTPGITSTSGSWQALNAPGFAAHLVVQADGELFAELSNHGVWRYNSATLPAWQPMTSAGAATLAALMQP